MSNPDFDRARDHALRCLEHRLSPLLRYHSLAHTRDDVVPAVERLARQLHIQDHDLLLLYTAAWYHDIGYVIQREDHETQGAQFVATVLPQYGYSQDHITAIQGMIMATRLPQTPHTILEAILADADLDSLGRGDFLATSLALRAELANFGVLIPEREWYARQMRFLQGHRYFTTAASALRDAQKAQNIQLLLKLTEIASP